MPAARLALAPRPSRHLARNSLTPVGGLILAGKPLPGHGGKGSANRDKPVIGETEVKSLSFRPHPGHGVLRDPPATMNLRAQSRVKQGYRICHSHQDQSASASRVDTQIVILCFQGDDRAANLGRKLAEQGRRKAGGGRFCREFRQGG